MSTLLALASSLPLQIRPRVSGPFLAATRRGRQSNTSDVPVRATIKFSLRIAALFLSSAYSSVAAARLFFGDS